VLSFYSYLILADADTSELESGRTNFEAQNIANVHSVDPKDGVK
jgi:hypothetical protein